MESTSNIRASRPSAVATSGAPLRSGPSDPSAPSIADAPAHGPSTYITEINGKNYAVDEENNRIQFLDSRFYKAGADIYVPSVTTILEAYPKGAQFYEWLKKNGEDSDEIRDEAGRSGSTVHQMTEALDYGAKIMLMDENGGPKYKLKEWGMFCKYVEFRERFPAELHAIELNMASAQLGYAGTLDRVLTMHTNRVTYLMDIKTGSDVHKSHWLQQAAYVNLLVQTGLIARLFPDRPVPEIRLAILHLNARTRGNGKGDAIQGKGWQFLEQPEETAALLKVFNHMHALWLEENANAVPRFTEYQLSHQLKPVVA